MSEWKYGTCVVCERQLQKDTMTGLEGRYVCDMCVEAETRHGKYDSAETIILEAIDADGMADDWMSQDGWGYVAKIGNWIYGQDDRGFRTSEEFPDVVALSRQWDEMYADGWGYQEDDAVINEDGDVYFGGKKLHIWPPRHTDEISDRRKLAAIRLEMHKQGFYPNVWREQRYGVTLVKDF